MKRLFGSLILLCALALVFMAAGPHGGGPVGPPVGGGGGAPVNAQYLVVAADGTLTNETVASGDGILLITAADFAAMRALLDLEAGTDFYSIAAANAAFQPLDADLTIYAGITPSADVQAILGAANYAAIRTLLTLVPGVDIQGYDADLATAAGATTWSTFYKNGAAALTALPLGANTRFFMSNGPASAPSWQAIVEAYLSLSDNTTNDATTLRHGFMPKLNGTNYAYLDGGGTWRNAVTMPADPNEDKIPFWDDGANAFAWLDLPDGMGISGTTITYTPWQAVYVAAAAFVCDGTNCSDPAAAQINSGPNQYYTTCSDAAGTIEFSIGMPENWDGGSIIIEPVVFSTEATPTGTIEWELSIQKCANDESIDNTWVTANGNVYFEDAETSNTTVDTQYDLFKCKNKTAMAAGGAGGDQLFIKLTRDNDDGTHDTSTQDINVLGIKVYYQVDALNEKD